LNFKPYRSNFNNIRVAYALLYYARIGVIIGGKTYRVKWKEWKKDEFVETRVEKVTHFS